MALDDITGFAGEPNILEMSRGDIGTVNDICVIARVEIFLQLVAAVADGDFVYIG